MRPFPVLLGTSLLAVALFASVLRGGDPQDSSNIIVIKDPNRNKFYLVAVTNAQYLHVHTGTRLDALTKADVGGRLRGLYLKRYVLNVQVQPGDGCRLLGWRPVDGLLCNGEPVVSYWETTFQDPMK